MAVDAAQHLQIPPRRPAASWAVWIAGALVLAAPSGAAAEPRHLGSFGVVCAPQRRSGAPAVAAQPEARTPPKSLTITLVIDLPCASTVDALDRLRDFRQSHAAVEVEILVLDPDGPCTLRDGRGRRAGADARPARLGGSLVRAREADGAIRPGRAEAVDATSGPSHAAES